MEKLLGLFPDDNFDILLSLEDIEIGINAASVLICTDCHCQAGADLSVLLMHI